MTPAEYLKRPYSRVVVPESDGTFRGEILEFPGCIAAGDTAQETLAKLEDVADSWLQSMLARGQQIPEPIEANNYSGKLVLRLSKSVHQKAAVAARLDGVSLNYFIANCVAEHVGARSRSTTMATHAAHVFGFSLHALTGPYMPVAAVPVQRGLQSPAKQVATSADQQLVGFPLVWQEEAANA
jgi:predicted HicB family RNase H-like nuclease